MFGQSFGQQSNNYYPNNGDYNNAWNTQQVNGPSGQYNQPSRKGGPPYDDYARGGNGYGGGSRGDAGIKSLEYGVQGMGLQRSTAPPDGRAAAASANNSQPATKEAPKKMTWATIASQPAKPQIRTSSSTSTLKKKGPGMPPPPMVPGKHNIDGSWDSPKNGPVPTPVPVPSPPPIIEPSPLSQQATKSNNNANNNNNSNTANMANNNIANVAANNNGQQQQQPHQASHHPQQQHPHSERGPNSYNSHHRHDGPSNGPYGRDRDGGGPGGYRPNWHGPNQRDYDGGRTQHQQYRSGPGIMLLLQLLHLNPIC